MAVGDEGAPHPAGGGLLPVEEFCQSTGLDRATVESLMRAGRLVGRPWSSRNST
jgi:hypothetical protein